MGEKRRACPRRTDELAQAGWEELLKEWLEAEPWDD